MVVLLTEKGRFLFFFIVVCLCSVGAAGKIQGNARAYHQRMPSLPYYYVASTKSLSGQSGSQQGLRESLLLVVGGFGFNGHDKEFIKIDESFLNEPVIGVEKDVSRSITTLIEKIKNHNHGNFFKKHDLAFATLLNLQPAVNNIVLKHNKCENLFSQIRLLCFSETNYCFAIPSLFFIHHRMNDLLARLATLKSSVKEAANSAVSMQHWSIYDREIQVLSDALVITYYELREIFFNLSLCKWKGLKEIRVLPIKYILNQTTGVKIAFLDWQNMEFVNNYLVTPQEYQTMLVIFEDYLDRSIQAAPVA